GRPLGRDGRAPRGAPARHQRRARHPRNRRSRSRRSRRRARRRTDTGERTAGCGIEHARRPGVIECTDVGFGYAPGSPWAHRALGGINLRIETGERLVVVGANGSGKSTLAWLLAGVLDPTEGTVRLDGEPIDLSRLQTAISFQHARLQLFRATVAADI